jgi:hypothetical protein
MRQSAVFGLACAALVAVPALAFADDKVADMKGKWVGTTHSIVVGSGGHWPTGKGTFENPARFEKDLVIEITGQDQRRFWGVSTIAGNGEKTTEPFIGALTNRGGDFLIADTDGFMHGEVDGDLLSFCYGHAGGKTASTVVSCSQVKRAH